jgi:Cu-Zn family superoxide dismutase
MFPRFSRLPVLASIAVVTLTVLSGCGSMMGPAPAKADVTLAPTGAITPNPTSGNVTFSALPHGVRVAGEVRGLAPGSEHGFHIHEKGDCGNNGDAAGGHFNPAGTKHGMYGAPVSHAGELPSLVADASGVARFDIELHSVSLGTGAPNDAIGRALIVHRDRDDFTTQPSGNSGPRVACAVITRP